MPDLPFFRRPISNVGRILESDISVKRAVGYEYPTYFFRRPISSVGRVLEPDILAKRGCRIRVSDLLFSDDLSFPNHPHQPTLKP